MLVDDDVNIRKCLRKLIPWDYIDCVLIAEAGNGIEGIQLFCQTMPDIVITDLKMPGMDGENFCRNLRKYSDDVSIIFLSSYQKFTAAEIARECDVAEYVLKPIDQNKIKMITDILKKIVFIKKMEKKIYAFIDGDNQEFYEMMTNRDFESINALFSDIASYQWKNMVMLRLFFKKLLKLLFEVIAQENDLEVESMDDYRKIMSNFKTFNRKQDVVIYCNEVFSKYLLSDNQINKIELSNKLIEKVKEYVVEKMQDSQLSIVTIAENFEMSPYYLGRVFRNCTGVTLVSYITHVRMNQACRMLKNTRMTINEIAFMTGYKTPSYFCKVFRKEFDISPNDYRNRYM